MGPLFGNDIENVYEIAKENGVCLLLHFKNIKCQLQHYLCQLLTLNIYISAFSVRWFFLWKFKRGIGGRICVPRRNVICYEYVITKIETKWVTTSTMQNKDNGNSNTNCTFK
jgi:hypothetical protein